MRNFTVVVAMILGFGLMCPSVSLFAAEPAIDPGAEDYWNMMAQKAEKEAKEAAEKEKKEKKDSTQASGTSTADRVKNSPRYSVPLINGKGSYAQGK
jgi:hypothetical protein